MERGVPSGPEFDLAPLVGMARDAARRWPSLAPRGGSRWTPEDVDRAVSLLYGILQSEAFRRAFPGGLDGVRSRGYLLRSLRNALVRACARSGALKLLGEPAMDLLPRSSADGEHLAREDSRRIARAFLAGCSLPEISELRRRLHGIGIGRSSPGDGARPGPSRATRARLWARIRPRLMSVAIDRELSRDEMGDILSEISLAVGAPRADPRNPVEG